MSKCASTTKAKHAELRGTAAMVASGALLEVVKDVGMPEGPSERRSQLDLYHVCRRALRSRLSCDDQLAPLACLRASRPTGWQACPECEMRGAEIR